VRGGGRGEQAHGDDSCGDERGRARAEPCASHPPAVLNAPPGDSDLHSSCAVWNVLSSKVGPPPPFLMRMPPPEKSGAGKFGTPCERMQAAHCSHFCCSCGVIFGGMPPLGRRCLHALS